MKIRLRNIPESLDDCSKKQILQIVKLSKQTNITPKHRRELLFLILIKQQDKPLQKLWVIYHFFIKPWYIKTSIAKFIHHEKYLNIPITVPTFDDEELSYEIEDATAFIFNRDNLLTQKVKYLKYFWKTPEDYFGNLTFRQFRNAEEYLYEILEEKEETGEINISDNFLKSICRNTISNNLPLKASPQTRELLLMYYIGNRKQLEQEFKFVFPQSRSKTQTPISPVKMWEDVLNAIAKVPQDFDKVDTLNIRYVLKNLDSTLAEIDRINNPKK